MTHPPYGDDGRARPSRSDVPPPSGRPRHGAPEPSSGAPGPFGPPEPFGPPRYGPPQGPAQPPSGPPQYGPPYGSPPYGSPPYGSPQYGPPRYGPPRYGAPTAGPGQDGPPGWPAPQPPRSRRLLLLLPALLVLVVVTGGALLGMGFRSTALDPQAVQRDVAEQFRQREGVAVELRCGDDMTVEAGRSYRCSGTTADGEPVTITIEVTDEDANYTWTED